MRVRAVCPLSCYRCHVSEGCHAHCHVTAIMRVRLSSPLSCHRCHTCRAHCLATTIMRVRLSSPLSYHRCHTGGGCRAHYLATTIMRVSSPLPCQMPCGRGLSCPLSCRRCRAGEGHLSDEGCHANCHVITAMQVGHDVNSFFLYYHSYPFLSVDRR